MLSSLGFESSARDLDLSCSAQVGPTLSFAQTTATGSGASVSGAGRPPASLAPISVCFVSWFFLSKWMTEYFANIIICLIR